MKKENDEITDLFRTRLADAGMNVRDGFWEELSQEIPVACQQRRRLLLFRVAAAASVLLVLAASSATFLYLSPKEEMEEAFTKIAVANGGQLDGDGIRVNQLPLPVEPVLPKPAPHWRSCWHVPGRYHVLPAGITRTTSSFRSEPSPQLLILHENQDAPESSIP